MFTLAAKTVRAMAGVTSNSSKTGGVGGEILCLVHYKCCCEAWQTFHHQRQGQTEVCGGGLLLSSRTTQLRGQRCWGHVICFVLARNTRLGYVLRYDMCYAGGGILPRNTSYQFNHWWTHLAHISVAHCTGNTLIPWYHRIIKTKQSCQKYRVPPKFPKYDYIPTRMLDQTILTF